MSTTLTAETNDTVYGEHRRHRTWNLETAILGLLGVVMCWQRGFIHEFSVVGETIVVVVFLGGLMGITRIPFPTRIPLLFPERIPLYVYPLISGFISGFMDSFLVLLLVGAAKLEGDAEDKFKFKAYNMIAALIGGLITYFGEVYMLPLALKYGMRDWYSMMPVVIPVSVFLAYLAYMTSKLDIRVAGMQSMNSGGGHSKKETADTGDYVEFAAAIVLLLITHNPLLCLGVLFVYSFVTGQGEDLIDVMKTETEVGVMLLLTVAAFAAGPLEPHIAQWGGWWAFVPATINGVFTGAIYPATGEIWSEVHILSTAVLITPISSLVGVMLFKTASSWVQYIKLAIPTAIVWFVLCGAWFYGIWPLLDDHFYSTFPRPQLVEAAEHH